MSTTTEWWRSTTEKLFVIRHENLDTETDIADPDHPHLYWSNMWGWGTYAGAAVHADSTRPSQSCITPDGTMRPVMFLESCHWEEVSPGDVGWSDPIEDDDIDGKGTFGVRREPCVVFGGEE